MVFTVVNLLLYILLRILNLDFQGPPTFHFVCTLKLPRFQFRHVRPFTNDLLDEEIIYRASR